MTPRQFEKFVRDNAKMGLEDQGYNVIGLNGEIGEVVGEVLELTKAGGRTAEWVKKAEYRKNPDFTTANLESELGDVLHYLTRIAIRNGLTLHSIMQNNMSKITERHAQKDRQEQRDRETHTCIKDDGGTPNRRCYACEYEQGYMR